MANIDKCAITLRVERSLKEEIQAMATGQRRSLASMLEIVIEKGLAATKQSNTGEQK